MMLDATSVERIHFCLCVYLSFALLVITQLLCLVHLKMKEWKVPIYNLTCGRNQAFLLSQCYLKDFYPQAERWWNKVVMQVHTQSRRYSHYTQVWF